MDEAGNYTYGYYFYDEAAAQWYVFDIDAYNEAYDAYYAVADRISLREALQESYTDITYYDLNAWTPDNRQSAVASNISPYTATLVGGTGIVTYQKYGELGKVDWPEDSYGTWFVSDYIEDCLYNNDGAYFYNYNGTENEWNDEWGNLSGGISFDVSSDGKYVMGFVYTLDDDDNYAISMNAYEVKDGTISLLESGISASGWGIWQEDGYYYFEQDSEDDGNLCCYANGKSTTVLKNISNAGVNRYDNGSCTAFTDGDTLKLFSEDGESTKIASGVNRYCYIDDGLIVYLSDEKLYVYRGEDEDKSKIDGSVTSFTCNGAGYETLLY
jgi:membrane-bound inhibitor of C-type lysozyme